MAIVINGSGTVTGLAVGGLPDGTVDSGTLASGIDKTSITDGGNSTAITIDASENVGIGVVPESWASGYTGLQIGGSGSIMSNGSSTYYSENYYYDGTDKYITTNEATTIVQANGKHQFLVAPSGSADAAITWTTALTIENDGRFHWGNWSSNGGTMGWKSAAISSSEPHIVSSVTTTSNADHYGFYNANGRVGYIRTNGSATSYNTSSDYRLKENVDYTWDATTRLKQLKPARFNFIADDTTTVDGFLAHEAQAVVPECVTGAKDAMMDEEYEVTPAVMDGDTVVTEAVMGTRSVPDMQGIDQSKLVPLLVKTIQELEARITALEA